jgi:hypothetical protein
VKEALKSPGSLDFVKSFREESKLVIVRRGGNQAGRFLEVSSFAVGGRKGSIWLPEGRDGRGWRRFAGELSKMVAVLESPSGSLVGAVATSDRKKMQLSSGGFLSGVRTKKGGVASSYAEAVRGTTGFSAKIAASSRPKAEMCELDLLPMSRFRDEEDLRVAMDCFDMEVKTSGLMEKKSTIRSYGGGKTRTLKLNSPSFWKVLLGVLRSELLSSDLDRVALSVAQLFGLGPKPKRSSGVKCTRVGFKPIWKKKRGSVSVGRGFASAGVESGPCSGLGSDLSNMVSDPGLVLVTDSSHFPLPVSPMASSEAGRKLSPQFLDPVDLGHGSETSALGPQVSIVMGSPEGRILPSSSLVEPTSKPLIQFKRKGRKTKSVVGQGKHKDVGFLRRGFLESSSSSLSQADRSFSSARPLNSVGGLQAISPLELSLACSSFFGDKGDRTMAFLSALDEDHRRWDMIEDCEL